MAEDRISLREEIGLKCLNCGRHEFPPNRVMHNWSCGYCHSGFITTVMLSNLTSKEMVRELLYDASARPSSKACPMCHKTMQIIDYRGTHETLALELCRKCHLVWFEGGGIVHLLRVTGLKPLAGLHDPLPAVGVRTLRSKGSPKEVPLRFPLGSAGLLILFVVIAAFAEQVPGLIMRFGFLPQNPLRELGFTWISSLFIHTRSGMSVALAFTVFAAVAEMQLGATKIWTLFLLSGIVGRMTACVLMTDLSEPLIGSGPGLAAVAAYVVLGAPLRQYLFPKERWRSPVDGLIWIAIVGLLFALVFVLLDLFGQALGSAVSAQGAPFVNPFEQATKFFKTPTTILHLTAAAVGVVWASDGEKPR